eukprot:SAG11_NODE_1563_length_4675_cov_10.530376_1_plen_154_part_00
MSTRYTTVHTLKASATPAGVSQKKKTRDSERGEAETSRGVPPVLWRLRVLESSLEHLVVVEAHFRGRVVGRCLSQVELGVSCVADTEQPVHQRQQRWQSGAPVELLCLQDDLRELALHATREANGGCFIGVESCLGWFVDCQNQLLLMRWHLT